ncbi:MAG: NrdJb [Desulfuromonadales bacterium]
MATKIDKKIVAYEVINLNEQRIKAAQEEKRQLEDMHEKVERPEMLVGATYKIKTPQSPHALYVTINDMVLNHGTEHETRQPFEIFINSKNLDHYQWVVALTRVMSAVFRKGGDVTFLVDEMKAVFDPQGGYFKPGGGGFMPSLVAEIGFILERHMKMIGLLQEEQIPEAQREMLQAKQAEYDAAKGQSMGQEAGDFPAEAKLCSWCYSKAVILMAGCLTCLNCGDSKCG